MSELTEVIKQQIITYHGKIPFAEYMQYALYAPGIGYYTGNTAKFGEHGDFITAPLLTSTYSACVATQCQQVLEKLPGSSILELGAGTGQMAADILLELEYTNRLPNYYYILEPSSFLQEVQLRTIQTVCPRLQHKVVWLQTLPASFKGLILANEVLDAMPVHLFTVQNKQILEKYVTYTEGQFQWILDTPTQDLQAEVMQLDTEFNFSEGYTSEVCLLHKPWIASLADILQEGVILLIDYGFSASEYYHPQRHMGTLMCHYQHTSHDNPLLHLGNQDITAHVNFTLIAQAANNNRLDVIGYTTQAHFLINTGLLEKLSHESLANDYHKNQAVKRLLMPGEMGEIFKVMALGRHFPENLIGFKQFDMRMKL